MNFPILSVLGIALSLSFPLSAQLPTEAEDVAPLLVGEIFPNYPLVTVEGSEVNFHEVLKTKPTVLIFYRGGWCPYCNAHLAEIGRIESEILNLGFQVVAVSPDKPEELQSSIDKNELGYQLLSDGKGALTSAAGIAFQAPDRYQERLAKFSDGLNEGFLPVPSVFVLDTRGEIQFEYINPNYKKRLSGDLLLAVLQVLKREME